MSNPTENAFHEASHVVVALACGLRVESVTIIGDMFEYSGLTKLLRTDSLPPMTESVIYAAGDIGQYMWIAGAPDHPDFGECFDPVRFAALLPAPPSAEPITSDREVISILLPKIKQDHAVTSLDELAHDVAILSLRDPARWGQVLAIAKGLLMHFRLNETEMLAIIASAPPADWGIIMETRAEILHRVITSRARNWTRPESALSLAASPPPDAPPPMPHGSFHEAKQCGAARLESRKSFVIAKPRL